ncbi:hypothetical protein [Streptomyces tailanensis]|uniref:hypothetical protein n=1 Tax=Streptomyces tailanensis TaxID=2569858 RepID=UPI00122E17EC|nr:hypothetical protein [Streptomyces tailanensis]
MGLFDKLTGTKHPVDGVAPDSAEEVRAALLGLNRSDVPYVVRDGGADDADLMTEWRVAEPAWQTFFVASQLTRLEATETFRFDSAELRDPLRNAVLDSGWTWRAVVFGKL